VLLPSLDAPVADNLKVSVAFVERLPDHRIFIAPKESPGK
jgi:hypothetical protein